MNLRKHVKDPFKSKYQLGINGREKVGIKKKKNSKAVIDYSQTNDNFYKHLEDYNTTRKKENVNSLQRDDSRYKD